jgi:chorismate mutase
VKAIRGAITVSGNTEQAIHEATREILSEIARRNRLEVSEVVSVLFTLTADLNAAFPARAARMIGWDVPMLDTVEVTVPGAISHCLRIMVHVDRDGPVRHAYLREARSLRPDLEENA